MIADREYEVVTVDGAELLDQGSAVPATGTP